MRCPECGTSGINSAQRPKLIVRLGLIAMTLALAAISLVPHQFVLDRWVWWNRFEHLEERCSFGDITVEGCTIVYDGLANPNHATSWMRLGYLIKVHRAGSEIFRLFLSEPNSRLSQSLNGLDLTGDYLADIVVESKWLNRRTTTFIDADLLTWVQLDELDGDPIIPVQSAKDSKNIGLQVVNREFTCWEGTGGPAPIVILSMKNGKLIPDVDMMRAPPPSTESLNEQADEICMSFPDEYGTTSSLLCETGMLQPMLDLVFSGHPDLAETFLARACPNDMPNLRQRLLESFHQRLRESTYWSAIVELAPDYWQHVEAPK